MDDPVSEEVKERRWQELMELQASISRKKNEALIGAVSRVIVDTLDADSGLHLGRTQAHAPEVDGAVYVKGKGEIRPGDFVAVKITQAQDYDLIGEITHG